MFFIRSSNHLRHHFHPHLLPVLAKELQNSLVPPDILALDALVLQVAARRHPAVDLVLEGLDVLGHAKVLLKLLDLVLGLLLRGEQDKGNLDALGLLGVNHGRVALGANGEGVILGLGD